MFNMFSVTIFTVIFLSAPAMAQEWGATVGVHQTTADSNDSTSSIDGNLNFRAGALVAFDLVENAKFRSGFLYNRRHIDLTRANLVYEYNFDYFDIPANVQYNFNEMVGVFGGLIFAMNISDDVAAPPGITVNPKAEGLIALMNIGINLTFSDMIGFDFYFERGMGRFATNLENYSTFGGSFLFWF